MKNIPLLSNSLILEQLPGYFAIKTVDSVYHYTNQKTAKILGFKCKDEITGKRDDELKCPSADLAEFFVKEDKLTLQQGNAKFLFRLGYADKEFRIGITEKNVLKDEHQNIVGVSVHMVDVTNYPVINLSEFLMKKDLYYTGNAHKRQFSYQLSSGYTDHGLSEREAECLFFILRGKSCLQIAKILDLSVRTVEVYVANLKSKLNCINKSQLIEKSLANGFLYVISTRIMQCIDRLR